MFYAIVKFNFLAERLSPQNMHDLKDASTHISQTMRVSTMWVDEDQLDEGMCSLCFSIFAASTKELNQKIEDIGFQVESQGVQFIESENIFVDTLSNLEDIEVSDEIDEDVGQYLQADEYQHTPHYDMDADDEYADKIIH